MVTVPIKKILYFVKWHNLWGISYYVDTIYIVATS